MALFEYDQGHLIPAQFGNPVAPEAQGEILDSLRHQVLEVIARPLFPVTWTDMTVPHAGADGSESPRLTALDGSGQVVLVEVMEHLDSVTLIESLGRLGAVSNLGWNDLATAYPGGISAFRSGWTAFRDAMPPNLPAGPRLILVATDIDPEVRPALDALAFSGLEVHHVSVREMSNGRRFLDVQRVATSLFEHDANLLAGRAARVPALTSSADEDFQPLSGAAPLSDVPLAESSRMPLDTVSAAASSQMPAPERAGGETPASNRPEALDTSETSEPAAVASAAGEAPSELALPQPVDEPKLQTGSISRHSIMESASGSAVSPLAQDDEGERVETLLWSPTYTSEPKSDVPSFSEVVFGAQDEAEPEPPRRRRSHEPSEPSQMNALLNKDAAGLYAIAQVIGEDTQIVATVSFDGATDEVAATLLARGVIQLEGKEFDDPDAAASSLGQEVDGWDFWHLGTLEGPTLAEARSEINAEIQRI